ncbi:MAG: HTH domain-containing protein, partial [Bradymonadaceae bacterium]
MTFYEAAIEVLFRAGRPLHFKKITEAAIKENLLSHVGRTPEVTMGERLDLEIKRQDDSPVQSVRPGVFALREEYIEKLKAEGYGKEREAAPVAAPAKEEKAEAVAAPAEEADRSAAPVPEARSNQRRRRRRSSRNGANGAAEPAARADEDTNVKEKETEKESTKEASSGRGRSRGRGRSSGRRGSSGRRSSRGRRQTGRKQQSQAAPAAERSTKAPQTGDQKHLATGPVRLEGIAEAACTVLKDSAQKPLKVQDIADTIFERKLVRFHTHDPATTVQAAMASDNQLRSQRGHRPLFVQYDRERWGLSEWGLSSRSLAMEQQILSLSEEIRQDAVTHLATALQSVKTEALEHLALTLLERLGYRDLKVSKRSSDGDVFFTADWRQGLADVRVCIQVVGDSATELASDTVSHLRGTLHHYSASEGVIIHLGDISADAVKESREEKLAAVTLIDRKTFGQL